MAFNKKSLVAINFVQHCGSKLVEEQAEKIFVILFNSNKKYTNVNQL